MSTSAKRRPARRLNRAFFVEAGRKGGQLVTGPTKCSQRTLTDAQVRELRTLAAERDVNWLAAHFGVSPRVVRRVLDGVTFRWVGGAS